MPQHPPTEDHLSRGHYAYEFRRDVPIKSIDLVGARINPARLYRKVNDDVVTKYGVAMLDGAQFPAIVVFDLGAVLLALCTGLHRLEAALECKLDTFDAYVVMETVEARRDLLTASINSIEGHAQSQGEDLRAAVEQWRLHNAVFSQKEIARSFNLKEGTLALAVKTQAADGRAQGLGILDQFCGLPGTLKTELHRIHDNHNFVAATLLVAEYNLRGGEANSFVKDVVKARGEQAGNAVVTRKQKDLEQREKRAQAKHGKTRRAKSTRAIGLLKSFIKMGPLANLGLDGIEDTDVPEARMAVQEAKELVEKVEKSLIRREQEIERKAKWESTRRGERLSGPDLHP